MICHISHVTNIATAIDSPSPTCFHGKTRKKIQVNENGTTHITLTPRQHHPTQQQQQHAHAQQEIHHHDRTSNSHSANNNRVRFLKILNFF